MIPFSVTIPEGERDPHLSEKLKTEWPGILAWAISGCLDWQSQGLKAPESVMVATDDYMSSQDAMGAWLEERCLISPRYSSSTSAMFEDWKSWAEQNNEYTGSQRWFTEKMKSRDAIQHQHTRDGRRFTGVALRKDVPHESDSACEA